MSYTNIDLVRHHLVTAFAQYDQVHDQSVILTDDSSVTFYAGGVEESSVKVKSVKTNELTRQSITLNTITLISTSPIVPGSVVVADTSSLGRIYVENVDYVVNYATGQINIGEDGSLSLGMSVTIWHLPFTSYSEGVDFRLDGNAGTFERMSGGAIAPYEQLWLDYTPLNAGYDDTVLTNAVTEANGIVSNEVDPDQQFGADSSLQAAATYRALEIVCLAAATRQLSSRPDTDRAAQVWMKLADSFGIRSAQLIKTFRPPVAGPANPTRS